MRPHAGADDLVGAGRLALAAATKTEGLAGHRHRLRQLELRATAGAGSRVAAMSDLESERKAVRAASAPGELPPKRPEPSIAGHVLRMIGQSLLFGLVVTLAAVALMFLLK